MKSVKLEPGSRQRLPSSELHPFSSGWLSGRRRPAHWKFHYSGQSSGDRKALVSQLFLAEFWSVFFSSCLRISLGFLGAFLLAAVFGAAAYFLRPLRELLAPAVLLMKSVPVVSFVDFK